ncbi:unnamed protein product [Rotaria magnacalcarata]|uniref:Rnh202 triple barrel domain-containing protein n=4 Tax=Rotaria magnacalcarata TaxID=392030 RepID=A0A819W7B2_9BILA|nr:unnamed protein product [Rotaria magnacalcarata]CAF4118893.1 unnamed protein product [Rotaria magnacalcarata]
MSSSNLTPDRVLIVDKRLAPANVEQFHFVQLTHPRTKQEQSYAVDHQSKTVFELVRSARSHSSWFINDQHVLPDGSLYIVTPINLIFLLLPTLWSHARKSFLSLKTIMTDSLQQLQLDDDVVIEKLRSICDINLDKHSIKLNEEKFIVWLRDRIDRLKKLVKDEEHAFDLICEYLTDDIVEYCQQELKLHGNVRYDIPIGTHYLLKKRGSIQTKAKINYSTNVTDLSVATIDHAKNVLFEHYANKIQANVPREFHQIQKKSNCIFAKRARCWTAPHWLGNISIDDNCERQLTSFIVFCAFVKDISIDGYVIEIPHNHATATIEDFGRIFKQILRFLSDHDPAKRHCMNVSPSRIGQNGWVFEFYRITFFITTFTPHYPETHPRYSHGFNNYCHILFQPELSFLRHNLPDDTPDTNWIEPITSRDKTRVAFRDHGREYPIRPTIYYPPSHDMIRPLSNDLADIVEWWL